MTGRERNAATVCIFGFLRRYMDERGSPYALEKDLPEEGLPAAEIAQELSIPPEEVEAVFRNGRVINIYDKVFPGDRVSFFPPGTPGPYRVFLGIVRENQERSRREGAAGKGEGRDDSASEGS